MEAGKKDEGFGTDRTDANVFIQIFGDKNKVSEEMKLPHNGLNEQEEFVFKMDEHWEFT